jgi:hypothetical protein
MAVSNELTKTFKGIIQKEDLIDTGALLRSATVFIDIKRDVLQVNLVSKYYVKYLNDRYNITKQFMNSSDFKKVVESELNKLLEIKMFNILNRLGGDNTFNPRVQILINGR